jgi:hypothetical protein
MKAVNGVVEIQRDLLAEVSRKPSNNPPSKDMLSLLSDNCRTSSMTHLPFMARSWPRLVPITELFLPVMQTIFFRRDQPYQPIAEPGLTSGYQVSHTSGAQEGASFPKR